MGKVIAPFWTDEEMLSALRLRDHGYSGGEIGRHLGRSRAAVCGMLNRIDRDLAKSERRNA